ncbi:heterokaryon incompatibility protein-domain-containing protein [Cercophora newfieldiana]|uniref:Heterokaryon incompatibility protein-domain-containing protein n=1 Tax=Cercophora newfieldiana TaxID=92897 RepID=A0AA39XYY9_9PEZI|nr:heterokaryon incompatibility protein-domain-containing protein [Cercophora newfieldiana]
MMTAGTDGSNGLLRFVGSPWVGIHPGVPISEDPFAHSCLQQIRVWLQDCIHHHSECRQSEPGRLPTRVIDVGASIDATPCLYVSKGETAPYTTLSYRWGTNMTFRTTKENLTTHQKALDMETLPATFRDAISVTRRLGIRYLWIDALCIVQGDNEDWRRESGRMASVYGSSTLTLSATSSASPDAGLSQRRPSTVYFHEDFTGTKHEVHIRRPIYHRFLYEPNGRRDTQYPTLNRGWCFQERLLSHRVLHFTHNEMVWDCRSDWLCECGHDSEGEKDESYLQTFHKFRQRLRTKHGDQVWDVHQQWGQIIESYCSTSLTYESDMLPAISGIVQSLQNTVLGRYFAGLWELDIIPQLMWHYIPTRPRRSFGKPTTEYVAPSFSPLSRTGGNIYYHYQKEKEFKVKVTDIQTTPLGSDPIGAVIGGHITLVGPTLAVRVISITCYLESGATVRFSTSTGQIGSMNFMPDANEYHEAIQPDDQLFLLQFHSWFWLVLRRDDQTGIFRRIGCSLYRDTFGWTQDLEKTLRLEDMAHMMLDMTLVIH